MAIESEKADLTVYKFYVDFAIKRYRRDIRSTYKQIDSVLRKRNILRQSQKSKGKNVKSLKSTKKEVKLEKDEDEKKIHEENQGEKEITGILKESGREEFGENHVRFEENPAYDSKLAKTDLSKRKIPFLTIEI